MGTIVRRHTDLSDAAARQAALRGATLLVLVSLVMAGSPSNRGSAAAVPPSGSHRDARLVIDDHTLSSPTQAEVDEVHGATTAVSDGPAAATVATVLPLQPQIVAAVRPLVRVALLDLPPPARA